MKIIKIKNHDLMRTIVIAFPTKRQWRRIIKQRLCKHEKTRTNTEYHYDIEWKKTYCKQCKKHLKTESRALWE